jgi:hypothetical protein
VANERPPFFGRSIRVKTFLVVFQYLTRGCIYADFLGYFAALDVERVPQATAALFLLELFIGNLAGKCF